MADVQAHEALTSDEEHSVLEDDSDDGQGEHDYIDDDDGSSELSIPNESIDFDLVYALHSFAATVEGQANVVKGDSLFLMDDSNSYWWLVRVLKTQEVGYIPAENIETPFERLARLNKHRNVDLASATQAELQEEVQGERDRLRTNLNARIAASPSPTPGSRSGSKNTQHRRSVVFTPGLYVHRYPPAVWNEDEEEDDDVEWDDEGYEDEDPDLAEEQRSVRGQNNVLDNMEPDDGMSWEDGAVDAMRQNNIPVSLRAGGGTQPLQQRARQPLDDQSIQSQPSVDRFPEAGMDPEQAPESTRQLSVTPTIAREGVMESQQAAAQASISATADRSGTSSASQAGGPLLPSMIMQQQEQDRKRTREEIEALEEAARKKANVAKGPGPGAGPVRVATDARGVAPSASSSGDSLGQPSANNKPSGGKLRKERDRETQSTDEEGGKEKKKKGGVLSGLFGRRNKEKDKSKDRDASSETVRESEESGRSSGQLQPQSSNMSIPDGLRSPVSEAAHLQQQNFRNSTNPRQLQAMQQQQTPQTPPHGQALSNQVSPLSQHASTLRQRDQQQQALYQQYLNRSPASPPEAQPSYGLQSAAAMGHSTSFSSSMANTSANLSPNSEGRRPRPGSLVLTSSNMDGGVGVPELSVIRVFAGKNVQTEATFKTVLLNSSTTSSDLVRQAIQRFRLPAGEDEGDYYLTVKQVEGSSAVLKSEEHPLVVFETLVEEAMEAPKVKRSSVGSISSVASNLSMHPAIKKLPMNDFTDDSAVKFYLNRRSERALDDSFGTDEGDETIIAESSRGEDTGQFLTVGSANVSAERFSSPSFRFALQLYIYPEDLPDDMVFDPLTEAIIFKNTLRNRAQNHESRTASGVSQSQRRKIFVFPKNVTVAEVIELGLERFGILEGVVDGGDEVEDKMTKRRSSSRVRYSLHVDVNGQERELSPSTKVIDAYPRPPAYRPTERRAPDSKRRSVDFAQLVGSPEDISPDDPIFILRRAVAYRNSSSRHRTSAPLDEIALQHLQRDLVASSSDSSVAEEARSRQMSKQELIAAQRAAKRADQRAILSAQTNSLRGVDVLLPGNAILRSSRYEVDDRIRYSYVDGDGETYDISDIIEEEWQDEFGQRSPTTGTTSQDLLQGVLVRNKEAIGDKLDRVLNKVKEGRRDPEPSSAKSAVSLASMQSSASSAYSDDSRAITPVSARLGARSPTPTDSQRIVSPGPDLSSSRVPTPTQRVRAASPSTPRAVTPASKVASRDHDRQPSIASVLSDISAYGAQTARQEQQSKLQPVPSALKRSRPIIPKDDFGLSHMMAIIELDTMLHKEPPLPQLDGTEAMLFGRSLQPDALHPDVREIYSPAFRQLEEMDHALNELLSTACSPA
ncbi:hypothetical protein PUNSTDRAFT_93043 [Punctularia strigosozonata HHB-11173 SS5]|uniref:SH3 domain-containing protein n=1 Tax=Punctularia strigosozonata (strain HHB-11173) TaxID=741275 RepID=R7S4W7_PUNST|nr:uncharacterized protein PUNSTDRAFT_93043 [Punctularia strigosozonata HHB-11173 SS5]EIN04316.1 hypothetical protein PUNSTDRAFT_93043 [Punctularia strigosozonata HHB-11173 SS5]